MYTRVYVVRPAFHTHVSYKHFWLHLPLKNWFFQNKYYYHCITTTYAVIYDDEKIMLKSKCIIRFLYTTHTQSYSTCKTKTAASIPTYEISMLVINIYLFVVAAAAPPAGSKFIYPYSLYIRRYIWRVPESPPPSVQLLMCTRRSQVYFNKI